MWAITLIGWLNYLTNFLLRQEIEYSINLFLTWLHFTKNDFICSLLWFLIWCRNISIYTSNISKMYSKLWDRYIQSHIINNQCLNVFRLLTVTLIKVVFARYHQLILRNISGCKSFPFTWFWLARGPGLTFLESSVACFTNIFIANAQINNNVKAQKHPNSMNTTLKIPSITIFLYELRNNKEYNKAQNCKTILQ